MLKTKNGKAHYCSDLKDILKKSYKDYYRRKQINNLLNYLEESKANLNKMQENINVKPVGIVALIAGMGAILFGILNLKK